MRSQIGADTSEGCREVLDAYNTLQDLDHISVWRIRGEDRDAVRIA